MHMLSRVLMANSAGLYPKAKANGTRRTRRAASKPTARKSKPRLMAKSNGKMRAGSAAAKAWGAKMKRLRKRRG